jgi:hypothetical protein
MSVQAMSWALTQQEITNAAARHVLLCLANYADSDGNAAFPSVATLSRDTGLAERTVRYKLDELESAGVIKKGNQRIVQAYIDRGDRRPICFDIVMKRGAPDAGRNERGAPHDRTGCTSRQNGVHLTTERGAGGAPNPSYKPSYKPSIKPPINLLAGSDEHGKPEAQVQQTNVEQEKRKPAKRRSKISEDYRPNEKHRDLAEKLGVSIGGEFPQFVDYHTAKGSVMADWDAAFNTWLRNAAKYRGGRTAKPTKPGALRQGTAGINYHEGIDADGRF